MPLENQYQFFASCPKGLENILESEILELSLKDRELAEGGVSYQTDLLHGLGVIFHSRVASRLFLKLFDFNFRKEKDIHPSTVDFEWWKFLDKQQTFKITTLLDRPSARYFKNSLLLSQLLKDALADAFRNKFKERPSVDTHAPDQRFLLRIEDDPDQRSFQGTVWLDLCGEPLSNRGYRTAGHEAPLRENLAAGIIQSTDWKAGEESFVDCMCGSGTLLIEAFLMAHKITPSYLHIRDFLQKGTLRWDFLRNPFFRKNKSLLTDIQKDLARIHQKNTLAINQKNASFMMGVDINKAVVRAAQANLSQAMLAGKIIIRDDDARTMPPPLPAPGVVICNPPYGERLKDPDKDLGELYYQVGENWKKNWKGYRAYLFTGNQGYRKRVELATSQRITLHNGELECRLVRYELY